MARVQGHSAERRPGDELRPPGVVPGARRARGRAVLGAQVPPAVLGGPRGAVRDARRRVPGGDDPRRERAGHGGGAAAAPDARFSDADGALSDASGAAGVRRPPRRRGGVRPGAGDAHRRGGEGRGRARPAREREARARGEGERAAQDVRGADPEGRRGGEVRVAQGRAVRGLLEGRVRRRANPTPRRRTRVGAGEKRARREEGAQEEGPGPGRGRRVRRRRDERRRDERGGERDGRRRRRGGAAEFARRRVVGALRAEFVQVPLRLLLRRVDANEILALPRRLDDGRDGRDGADGGV